MSSEGHLPAPGRPVPSATYRLQLRPEFGFADAAEVADYLAALGVSHAYLSPVLQAAPGSTHGYDVVDHSQLSRELGGAEGFDRLAARLRELDLGAVVDVVPNHMAVPVPASLNAALWSVLRDGPESPYAQWFDVDWTAQEGGLLMPVLGSRIGQCIDAKEITLDTSGDEPVVRYYDHVFPVRAGTEDLPLEALLDAQYYRLAYWRVADDELNYRRFFDVDTLAGLRVEHEAVFAESHALLVALLLEGKLDGLRIDHPDGLADPRGYLRRLAAATGGSWVVVEKILEGVEALPDDWPCAGTTGYDALNAVLATLVDPAGARPLTDLYTQLTGEPADFAEVLDTAKRDVVRDALFTEVLRLRELVAAIAHADIRLRDHTRRGIHRALDEMLVAFHVYRAYVVPGEEPPARSVQLVEEAAAHARERVPEVADEIDLVRDLALGRFGRGTLLDEFVVRFQQTCGPVMAKGVEDTAFYRWFRLAALNEVGGDPVRFGPPVEDFHAYCALLQRDWPLAMTTLSTHDTKRSEDVRARLAVLSEAPDEWGRAVTAWRAAAAAYRSPDGYPEPNTEYLIWQTLVGTWPIDAERLVAYLEKATREAKRTTSWVSPNDAYDKGVREFAERVLADETLRSGVEAFVRSIGAAYRSNVLTQKLVALTMPGVPDVYQGCEVENLSLVDPDNRRSVDYGRRRDLLRRLDEGWLPGVGNDGDGDGDVDLHVDVDLDLYLDAAKLLVTSRALRLRRDRPELFGAAATYEPVLGSGPAADHLLAFARSGQVVTLATRLPVSLARSGGWADTSVPLPAGRWRDLLGGRAYDGGGDRAISEVLATLPVALLVREP